MVTMNRKIKMLLIIGMLVGMSLFTAPQTKILSILEVLS
jgi:hypothetical protein